MEQIWGDTSQAEWLIPCWACNYWNIPRLGDDLDAMLGPNLITRKVSEAEPGVVCAKCGRPVHPRQGQWVHAFPERRHSFPGYHVPQFIMPWHYGKPAKWLELLGKRQGFNNTSPTAFYNECCAESYDVGAKLVSISDLRKASTLPHDNDYGQAAKKSLLDDYTYRVVGVDWGGGGQEEISFTAAVVLGITASGRIDVLYAWRSRTPHDPIGEASFILKMMVDFRCHKLVHDYTGAGALRETILDHSGLPPNRLVPIAYLRAAAGPIMRLKGRNPSTGQRAYYQVDKSRSLELMALLIRSGGIRFFKWDDNHVRRGGVLSDFLTMVEDLVDSRLGTNVFTVIRNEKLGSDDVAQATNIGCCGLFNMTGKWPDLGHLVQREFDPRMLESLHPVGLVDWEDIGN